MIETPAIAIELLTRDLRFDGLSADADPSRRISDLLNSPATEVLLRSVQIKHLQGITLETCSLASVQKRDVVMAIPRESAGQLTEHRTQRFGIAAPKLTPVPVVLSIPPYLGRGVINYKAISDFYHGVAALAAFFPLLDASLRLDGRLVEQAPVILVNRDAVVSIGVIEDAALSRGPASLELFGKMSPARN